ncbi:uncharacterized protein LOC126587103 [Malus sylvestris]|uniref:uncharacterized protein LOC126587103 n=1 Tax=Malus sylvestris TaxID=3752 RepID=UPI0021ABDDA2|nr:uncharacterized protein LOC126587103 [Malus sylvestris]
MIWNGRPKSHWDWLCDNVYNTTLFFQNAINRKKHKYHHKGGARPFIQHARKAQMKGNPLSVIDNWRALHKDKNGQWINDVARDKYDNMKKKNDEVREKLIQKAPEGTIFDSIQVPLEDEFGIMAENLGRKGKSVNGVGLFPRTDTFSCVSSMASSSELTDMRDQIKILSDGFLKLQ